MAVRDRDRAREAGRGTGHRESAGRRTRAGHGRGRRLSDPDAARRLLVWSVTETRGFDSAWVEVAGRSLRCSGRVVGQVPVPYWFEYELETGDDFVHRRLTASTRWAGGSASLELVRDGDGTWRADGVVRPDLERALDCDLFACPMTNTMPILRHGLQGAAGEVAFVMAFVRVPSLEVVPNEQRYTHLGPNAGGTRVRYTSGSFSSDLLVNSEGFVVDYPQLGTLVHPR